MYWCWTVFETRFDFLYVKTHCTNFVRCIYYITKLGEMHTIIEKSHRKTTTWRRRMIMLHTMLALVTMPLTYIRVVHTHTRWNRGIETERERLENAMLVMDVKYMCVRMFCARGIHSWNTTNPFSNRLNWQPLDSAFIHMDIVAWMQFSVLLQWIRTTKFPSNKRERVGRSSQVGWKANERTL